MMYARQPGRNRARLLERAIDAPKIVGIAVVEGEVLAARDDGAVFVLCAEGEHQTWHELAPVPETSHAILSGWQHEPHRIEG